MTSNIDQIAAQRLKRMLEWATPQSEISHTPLSPEEIKIMNGNYYDGPMPDARHVADFARVNAEHDAKRFPLIGLLLIAVGIVVGAGVAVAVML